MITGFARAGQALSEPSYIERATKAADFLHQHAYNETAGTLLRTVYNGPQGEAVQMYVDNLDVCLNPGPDLNFTLLLHFVFVWAQQAWDIYCVESQFQDCKSDIESTWSKALHWLQILSSHMKRFPWENEWSPWAHGELTVVTAPGPDDHGSRLGHSLVMARSQLNHGSVMARSQLNHGPGHGSVTAGCDHFGHRELTVSSHGGQFFFSWVICFSFSFVCSASPIAGFCDDYAFLIRGLLDLYEASLSPRWLEWAAQLQTTQLQLFWDQKDAGFYQDSGKDESIVLRMKEGRYKGWVHCAEYEGR